MFLILALVVLVGCTQGSIFDPRPNWDGLQVTWGPNPFNSDYFFDLPRTTSEATAQGYTKISDCDVNAKWRGQRYVLKNDYAVIVLYDVNGYIAGIQTSIPNNQADGYPKPGLRPPFVTDGDRFTISAYFVDPAVICTTGRSLSDYATYGTGRDLYLQKTDVPEQSIKVARNQEDVDKNEWTEGKCFFTMGKHFWNNMTADTNCDENYPVFIMYNGGKLNSFGWALNTDLPSVRYEHPTSSVFSMFMNTVPRCLKSTPKVSTMHIYMTSNAALNFC